MGIKKGDFIKINFTGRTEEGLVFDTTEEKAAKEAKVYDEKISYKPILLVVGKQQAIRGIDEAVEGMEPGQTKELTVAPEKAFGERNADMITVVPAAKFEKENINPAPGLLVTIDNRDGMVRSVGGGRVIVDFNHPLAGKTLKYTLKVEALLKTVDEKVKALFDDAGLIGEVTVKNNIIAASTKADPSTDYIYRKQNFLSWMQEMPDVKKVTFNEEYEIKEGTKKELE